MSDKLHTVVIITGGFDPVHSGHLSYINAAKRLGDLLLIGLNSDQWLTKKKGQPFMPFRERKCVLENLRSVDKVIQINDADGSACDAIAQALIRYPNSRIIFANGGDRTKDNTPEQIKYADNSLVEFHFGVGGFDKLNSSSSILKNWSSN